MQDVVTRWNSTYLMLERALKLKEPLLKVLEMEEWASKVQFNMRETDWDTVEKVVSVLQVCVLTMTVLLNILLIVLSIFCKITSANIYVQTLCNITKY